MRDPDLAMRDPDYKRGGVMKLESGVKMGLIMGQNGPHNGSNGLQMASKRAPNGLKRAPHGLKTGSTRPQLPASLPGLINPGLINPASLTPASLLSRPHYCPGLITVPSFTDPLCAVLTPCPLSVAVSPWRVSEQVPQWPGRERGGCIQGT